MSENIDPNNVANQGPGFESLLDIDPVVISDNRVSSFDIACDLAMGECILHSWHREHQSNVPFEFDDCHCCNDPLPICIGDGRCRCALRWLRILTIHLSNVPNMSAHVHFVHWHQCTHHGILLGPINDFGWEQNMCLDEMASHCEIEDCVSRVSHTSPGHMFVSLQQQHASVFANSVGEEEEEDEEEEMEELCRFEMQQRDCMEPHVN